MAEQKKLQKKNKQHYLFVIIHKLFIIIADRFHLTHQGNDLIILYIYIATTSI